MPIKFSHSILYPYLLEAYRLLISAYYDISKSKIKYYEYDENKLKNDLVKYAERKKKKLSIRLVPERPDVQNDNRIDISIIYSLDLFFADEDLNIECKILNNRQIWNYINKNGIISFVSGKYSSKLPVGGMLGFIDNGDVSELIKKINTSLTKHKKIITNQLLIYSKSINGYKNIYCSRHQRMSSKRTINIYHLMFDYNSQIA